jgi:GNAT superfamily N-acetyltransferase
MSALAAAAGVVIEAASLAHWEGLARLFEATSSPCYCRFWHFTGSNNAWLERCAEAPAENRAALERALAEGSDEGRGLVALAAGAGADTSAGAGAGVDAVAGAGADVVGWMKVAPATVMKKLYDRRLYKNLPCFAGDRSGVFVIGCALIHPSYRRRGVAKALVEGAVRLAPAWGARALEAFPRRPKEPVNDEELWTGPVSAFTASGFVEVNTFEPYPVLRRDL